MTSDLLYIGYSGSRAARAALEVTAQNIANANTEGYVRRTLDVQEIAASQSLPYHDKLTLAGVRIAGVDRQVDPQVAAEARRASGESAGAAVYHSSLEGVERAVENSGIFDAIVNFEASLRDLAGDPTNLSLRSNTLAKAQSLASSFRIASSGLDASIVETEQRIDWGVGEINRLSEAIGEINNKLGRAVLDDSGRASLLDQRDLYLSQLNSIADIDVRLAADGRAEIFLGDDRSSPLVVGNQVNLVSHSVDANAVLQLSVAGAPTAIRSGSLYGLSQSLVTIRAQAMRLDQQADDIRSATNAVQSGGVDLSGAVGGDLFSGSGANDLAVAFVDPSLLATAPAGSGGGSRDPANVELLRSVFASSGFALAANQHLFDISSQVVSAGVKEQAANAIHQAASAALHLQAGVDLDQEAANLVRFQQAFEASARAMQAASDIFDTLIGIG